MAKYTHVLFVSFLLALARSRFAWALDQLFTNPATTESFPSDFSLTLEPTVLGNTTQYFLSTVTTGSGSSGTSGVTSMTAANSTMTSSMASSSSSSITASTDLTLPPQTRSVGPGTTSAVATASTGSGSSGGSTNLNHLWGPGAFTAGGVLLFAALLV